jgi:hypothetical protein
MALGIFGLGVVVGREMLTWFPVVGPEHKHYVFQRILFAIAMLGDIPLVQITGAGAACWVLARRRAASAAAAAENIPASRQEETEARETSPPLGGGADHHTQ